MKNLWKQKYCISKYFINQIFLHIYICQIFLKSLWNQTISLPRFSILYIFEQIIWKAMKKRLYLKLFCYSDFSSYMSLETFFKRFLNKNILYLNAFWVISSLFFWLDWIYNNLLKKILFQTLLLLRVSFPYIFTILFLKNFWKQ